MDEHGMKLKQKIRVEEFFFYKSGIKSHITALDREDLYSKLPQKLVDEILYYTLKVMIWPMFQSFGSENFVKEIC